MRPFPLRRSWLPAIGILIGACQPTSPPPTPASVVAPSVPPSAATPSFELQFPSRNGPVTLPAQFTGDTLKARFVAAEGTYDGTIERTGSGLNLVKPMQAPAAGKVELTDGGRTVAVANYHAKHDLVDIAVDMHGASFPLRIEPAESAGVTGNRTIRVAAGSQLRLVIPEANTGLGEVQVQPDGTVGSLPHVVTGSASALRIEAMPLQLEMRGVATPVRVVPFETAFKAGNRLVHVLPGLPTSLAIGTNDVRLSGIAIGSDGSISQGDGQFKSLTRTIEPVVREQRFDAGAYTGTWRLRGYETTFVAGSRTIPILAGDRQLKINFGNFSPETAPFDPAAPTGAIKPAGTALAFNLLPVTVDPGDSGAPYQISPFEPGFGTGKRVVHVPRLAATATVYLTSGSDPVGSFDLDGDGTITIRSQGLQATASGLKLSTLPVRMESSDPVRAYRVAPFETGTQSGSRTVAMIRGMAGRLESNGTAYAFQVDGDGKLTSQDPHVQVSGSTLRVTWTP